MLDLSAIVLTTAVFPAFAAWQLARLHAPTPLVLALLYSSAVGALMGVAALRVFCRRTTRIMGKLQDGRIEWWSWLLWLPYHVGLRVKLGVGHRISTEPLWSKILPGW